MYTKMLTPFLAPGGTMPGETVEPGRKEGRKGILKIVYNLLIINVIHPVRVKGLYLSPYRTAQKRTLRGNHLPPPE